MKANDIRRLETVRLNERLGEIDEELMNLRFQKETGRLTNGARFDHLKKEYARIKTVLRERELAQVQSGS